MMNIYINGGSLIHPSVVLTAAQLVSRVRDQLRVRAGEWDTKSANEIYPHQDRVVKEVVTHKDFSNGKLRFSKKNLVLASTIPGIPGLIIQKVPVSRDFGNKHW
jgi:hypothetical protein